MYEDNFHEYILHIQ